MQVGFHEGTESILNCRVGMLKDKTVIISRPPVIHGFSFMIYLNDLSTGYVGEEDCR